MMKVITQFKSSTKMFLSASICQREQVIKDGQEIKIIGRAKRAPHWGVQSRFRVIYVYMYICRYVSYVKLTA